MEKVKGSFIESLKKELCLLVEKLSRLKVVVDKWARKRFVLKNNRYRSPQSRMQGNKAWKTILEEANGVVNEGKGDALSSETEHSNSIQSSLKFILENWNGGSLMAPLAKMLSRNYCDLGCI